MFIPDPRWEEPNLLIPGKKPTGPVTIDWSHPLARGLVSFPAAVGGGFRDLVGRVSWSANRPENWTVFYGEEVFTGVSAAAFTTTDPTVRDLLQGDSFTILLLSVYGDGAATSTPANMGWSGTDDLVFYNKDSGASNAQRIFWRNSPIGTGVLSGGVAGPPGAIIKIALAFEVIGGTAYEKAYVNGIVESSRSGTNNTRGAVTNFQFGRWETQAGFTNTSQPSCAAMWDRCLSDAEIAEISRNPYQILCPA